MGGKRKAEPKTAVKSKAKAKSAPSTATSEAGKPSRETTSSFLTGLKYKSANGKGMDKTNAQQLLQARVGYALGGLGLLGLGFRGLGLLG